MIEHRDDTTESGAPSPEHERSEPAARSYYYDDATGYELYDPSEEDEEDTEEPDDTTEAR